jgi:hypothetical protein
MSRSHDIFVSYAHVDNELLPGESEGWVTQLIATLEVYLRQKFGRREKYKLWRDPELSGNFPVTPEILDVVRESQIIVLVLSPGYVSSKWCLDELETFVGARGIDSGRVFVVERDKLSESERPPVLTDLKGYAFWVADKQQSSVVRTLGTPAMVAHRADYFRQVEDLAIQLVKKLKQIRQAGSGEVAVTTPQNFLFSAQQTETVSAQDTDNLVESKATLATVYVAPVPDTLQLERNDFIRVLQQHRIDVLPASNRINYSTFQQEMEADLGRSQCFIQLLDGSGNMGLVNAQYQIAVQSGVEVMQWRSAALVLEAVSDQDQLALLRGQHVMASDLVNFQQHLIKRLFPPEPVVKPELLTEAEQQIIFINVGAEDRALAEKVSKQLIAHGHFCLLPVEPDERSRPADIRKDMEQNMRYCDALLLLYDTSPITQIRQFLMQSWRMRAQRDKPLPTAVCISPNNQDDNLSAMAKNLRVLRCSDNVPFPAECVEAFLEETL